MENILEVLLSPLFMGLAGLVGFFMVSIIYIPLYYKSFVERRNKHKD
jgi:hypothetical protein